VVVAHMTQNFIKLVKVLINLFQFDFII